VGVPVVRLPLIYVLVGLFSAVAGPLIGRASDRLGKFNVFFFGCVVTVVMVIIFTHLAITPLSLLVTVLVILQIGIFSRMISASALMSALPAPADRGAYMSVSSSLQQMAGGVAAVLSGMIVVEGADGVLVHFDRVGYVLVGTTLLTLSMMYFINRRIGIERPGTEPAPMGIAVEEAG
jgi:predicted MFS family arabinose efflux permease